MPYYLYCRKNGIQPFIALNEKRGIKEKYKEDFTIEKDGVPVCKADGKWIMMALSYQKQD